MRFILIKEIIGLGILISLLNYLAIQLFLYWTTDWFDILMHFLGGLLIGLIVISVIKRFAEGDNLNKNLLYLSVILGVLVVGLGWELWEIFVGFTDVITDQTDTILDLIMDLIGSIGAVFYYYFKYSK